MTNQTHFSIAIDLFATDSGNEVPLIGEVTISPMFRTGGVAKALNLSPRPAAFHFRQHTGYIDVDGRLHASRGGALNVRLPANDPAYNLPQLMYRASYRLTTPEGVPVEINDTYFPAPESDVVVYLVQFMRGPEMIAFAPHGKVYAEDVLDASEFGVELITSTRESFREIVGGPVDLRAWPEIRKGLWKRGLCDWTIGGYTLTPKSFPFTDDDAGKIIVSGRWAGNPRWMATIVSVDAFGVATVDTAAPDGQTNGQIAFGFDITDALNDALLEVAGNSAAGSYPESVISTSGVTPREVYLPGWYRCRQIVVPGGITLRGAGWGNYNLGYESTMGTVLHQLPGSECDFMVFTYEWNNPDDEGYAWVGPVGVTNLQLEGPEHNVSGVADAAVGCGFSFRTADGIPLVSQDGCEFRWIHVTNFPEDGFNFGAGGVPLTVDSCRSFYNAGYAFNFDAINDFRTQMVHFSNCSCDGNILGGLRFKDTGPYGAIAVTAFKSEANMAADFEHKYESDPGQDCQMSAIIFDDCDRSGVVINGVSHIYGGATRAPGPTILIRSTTDKVPQISYNGIVTRYSGSGPGEEDAVTLRDEVNSIDVPRSRTSGWYLRGVSLPGFILTDPQIDYVVDSDGARVVAFEDEPDAADYFALCSQVVDGGGPMLRARGPGDNIPAVVRPKGSSAVTLSGDASQTRMTLRATSAASTVVLNLATKGDVAATVNDVPILVLARATITSTTTLAAVAACEYTYFLGSGAVPTLPTAVSNTSTYHLINTHTAAISVATTSSQTIHGLAAPLVIVPGESFTLVSDNANWWIR